MTIDDAQTLTDAAETADTTGPAEAAGLDDYPVGMLASPTRIRL